MPKQLTEEVVCSMLRDIYKKGRNKGFYDVDMFVHDVTNYDWSQFYEDSDNKVNFLAGVMRFIMTLNAWTFVENIDDESPTFCVILYTELENVADKLFPEDVEEVTNG